MTVSSKAILVLCCAATAVMGAVTNVPAVCLTALAEGLRLGTAGSGAYLSCAFWGMTAGLVAAGPFADRFGLRLPLCASALLQAAGLQVTAAAPAAWVACAGAMLVGLGLGTLDALVTPLVCAVYPDRRARTANLLHAFYPAGLLAGVLLALLLLRLGWSWRGVYRGASLLCLPYGAAALAVALPAATHAGTVRLPVRRLLGSGPFLLLAVTIFVAGLAEIGPSQWLPAYIERAGGGTRAAGAVGLLLFGATMTAGRLGNSLLGHRLGAVRLLVGGALLAAAMLMLAAVPAPPALNIAALAVVGLAISGMWPTVLALAGDRFPAAGASMFSLLSATGSMGCIAGPLVVGLVAERWGLRWGMASLSAAPLLLAAVASRLSDKPTGARTATSGT